MSLIRSRLNACLVNYKATKISYFSAERNYFPVFIFPLVQILAIKSYLINERRLSLREK
jgi:hypothetical protein